MAQDLDSIWKEIDTAYSQGNLKSIQPRVEEALRLSRAAHNVPLTVKGLFYSGMIRVATSDQTDDINPVFEDFQREIAAARDVDKSVWQVYQARLYQIYLEENRWRIMNRTDVENQQTGDVRFWTENTFRQKIREIYGEVLAQKALLLAQKTTAWKGILTTNPDEARNIDLTPTLYDVFTHYYVEFLNQQKEPADKYLEELAQINRTNGHSAAYLYNQALLWEKDTNRLEELTGHYPKDWYTAEIYKKLALIYYQKADKPSYERVFEIAEKVKKQFPDSEAATSVSTLVKAIRATAFSVESEKYIPEKTPVPVHISHRNLSRIYVRVLDYTVGLKDLNFQEASRELSSVYKDSEQRYYAFLKKRKVTQEYAMDLKTFDDYQQHSALFKLNELPKGRYIVMFSEDPEFKYSTERPVQYAEINVTNTAIAYDGAFRVTDRITGKPAPKKQIQVYKPGGSTDKPTYTLLKTLTTDANGQVKYSGERQFLYRLANEPVFYGQNLYRYNDPRESIEREITSTKIFTDRGIYRPGQTVYFKGIVSTSYQKQVKVLPGREVTIRLHDANGQEIQSLKLKTNDFGSVHGEFILPASALTGSFSLQTSLSGYQHFLVEEYKRPRFQVEIEKPQLSYQLNDSVQVSGKAEAFSGANIDHAAVEYRVYRQAIYPFRYWGRPPFEPEEQVAFGSAETDKNGRFSFGFKAIPAREQKDSADIRTYVYRVEAAVTDINGETQTGTGAVKVGDKKVLLSVQIEAQTDVKALESLKILATNLNDQPVETSGTLRVFRLKEPGRILRKAQYSTDYQYYSKAEFVKLFPHEPYGDEDKPENREKGEMVWTTGFDTQKSREVSLANADKLDEGYYLITLNSKDGVENRQVVYLRNEKKPTRPQDIFTYSLDKKSYEPGDVARLSLNTATDNLYVFLKTEADGKLLKEEVVRLKGKTHTLDIPIRENYRGGIWVHYTYVRFNVQEQGSIRIEVPFDHKKLQVTTAVTRDKLSPGAAEKWSFTVSGKDKDKVLAEMLTGMYDASLDQFAPNSFEYFAYNFYNGARHVFGYQNYAFGRADFREINPKNIYPDFGKIYSFLPLETFNFSFQGRRMYTLGVTREMRMKNDAVMEKSMVAQETVADAVAAAPAPENAPLSAEGGAAEEDGLSRVQARKALQETAFFFPNLKTDKDGNVAFEFTVPESLTEWKLMALAHTPDMKTGYYETRVKTWKDLMVVPNVPRFLREGDELRVSAKIVNLSEGALNGTARLFLLDAISNEPLDALFGNESATRNFTTARGESGEVSWTLKVPKNIQAVTYRVVASAGDFSDGEESVLPVVTNRMLVTETLPLHIRENQQKTFTLDKLAAGKTGDSFRLTFEMTTNPVWYAIFSLPYLREYPYECSEQVFSRLYGNLISENIITSQPKIKAVFDDWNRKGQLRSKLEVNQELKNILLEETPWVRDAVDEGEQMKRIAVLFDLNKMQSDVRGAFDKLSRKQAASGGFPWFDGGKENEYITTHIVAGFGNLKNMKVNYGKFGLEVESVISKAVKFLDEAQVRYYKEQMQRKQNEFDWNTGIHYLYARSFFLKEYPLPKSLDSLKQIYLANIRKEKLKFPLQTQAMAALVLNRFGEKSEAEKVLHSVKDHAVVSDEMGMYWKSNLSGWYWYQAPVETQALLIEAFHEITGDAEAVESMKVWLLKNRQTNQWNSTKATTKAVYALMNTGKSWIDAEKGVSVKIGGKAIDLNTPSAQAGSGYVKMAWNKEEIRPEMGKVEVQKTSPGVAWGALYWQYFEDLDKITAAETGIAFKKKLYLKKNSANGPVLKEITADTPLTLGDLVTVRLEISIDRNMEFVHIKDMRASGFEPVNTVSGYRWRDGFGYYESTRDLATNFFADYMRKGTYVFEYDLRANNAGNFSNGITQMQNMYAPELSAHSEGIRVEIR